MPRRNYTREDPFGPNLLAKILVRLREIAVFLGGRS